MLGRWLISWWTGEEVTRQTLAPNESLFVNYTPYTMYEIPPVAVALFHLLRLQEYQPPLLRSHLPHHLWTRICCEISTCEEEQAV